MNKYSQTEGKIKLRWFHMMCRFAPIRCGAALEILKHFFLDCPIYLQARTTLIGNINRVSTCYSLDIKFLIIKLRWFHMMCRFAPIQFQLYDKESF
jgi:uncharacterized membrane protein YhdT